jgi:carbonic anhydrase
MNGRLWIAAVAALLLTAGGTARAEEGHGGHGSHWGYTGEAGPAHWGELSEAYHMCAQGMHQSPVDIANGADADAAPVAMQYQATPLKVVYNGHTVQVNYAAGSDLTVDGKTYHLAQFHFHSPSEHTQDGKPYAMEAHLVHKADDGSLAVVGVFLKEGKENPFLARIWGHLPTEVNHEMTVAGTEVNVADLLPAKKAFFNYSGSLTTPPCSEGVTWLVMDRSVEVSKAQADKFRGLIHENARPVQPLNDRKVRHRM